MTMVSFRDELGKIAESNQSVRESVDRLSERVGVLAETLSLTQTTVKELAEARRKQKWTNRVLLGACVVIAVLVGFALTNRSSIDDLQYDLRLSQCETTGFFLSLAGEEPAEPETAQQRRQRAEFIKVYQGTYNDLKCDEVLAEKDRAK